MSDYEIGTESGSITTTTTGSSWTNAGDYPYYYEYTTPDYEMPHTVSIPSVWTEPIPASIKDLYNKCKGGDENMRYLYEVILVNPKNDTFYVEQYIARSETSALMEVYHNSQFYDNVEFDDLKTSCRVLMEWKKEKSLKKAIETIKEAVE